MLSIHPLMESQIDAMRILARSIWQTTYASLISQAQIDFMLTDRYAAARMRAQLDDPDHVWRLAWWDGEMVGFAHAYTETSACKLEKLYIHPNYQRRGIGGALLAAVKSFAREHAATHLWLQVNPRQYSGYRRISKIRIPDSRSACVRYRRRVCDGRLRDGRVVLISPPAIGDAALALHCPLLVYGPLSAKLPRSR